MIARSEENRERLRDTSLDFEEDNTLESMWIAEDPPDVAGQVTWGEKRAGIPEQCLDLPSSL